MASSHSEIRGAFIALIDQNNQAVKLMRSRNYQQASSTLASQVQATRFVIKLAAQLQTPQDGRCGRFCSGSATFKTFSRGCDHNSSHVFSEEVIFVENSFDSGYMCKRPLLLQKSNGSLLEPQDFAPFARLCSYVVMYNLALCYHFKGMSTVAIGQKQSTLQQAVQLYECAKRLLEGSQHMRRTGYSSQPQRAEFLDESTCAMHSIVVLNNVLHVKHLQRDEVLVQQSLQLLSKTVMLVSTERQNQRQLDISAPSDGLLACFDEILGNIITSLLFTPGQTALAA